MIKPIQILSDVISTTAHTVNISSIVDNGDGSYTLLVDNTYYLHELSKLTINSNDYRVKSFILNNTLVITGTALPTVTDFVLPSPIFVHGTPKKVSGELTAKQTKEYPIIWLLEFLESDYDDNFNSAITATLDLNLFFLTDINFPNWDIDTHYTQAIDPMSNEIDFIIKVIQKRRDLFGEITSHTVTNHVNFGEYITNKGYDKQILTDQVSGCQLKISLPYVVDVCNDSTVIVSKCFSATDTIKDSDSNTLYNNIIPSGGSNVQVIADGTNSLNGSSISGILAEGIKAITLKDDLGVTVNPTILTDTKTNLDLEIPSSATERIYIRPQPSGQIAIIRDYDDGWKRTNNADTYSPPAGGLPMYLNRQDIQLLIPDNIFNHKFRRTGLTGGYYDHLTSQYKDLNGTVTTRALAIPNDYVICHHSGIGQLVEADSSLLNIADALTYVNGLNKAGFNDYFLHSLEEIALVYNADPAKRMKYPPFDMLSGNFFHVSTSFSATLPYRYSLFNEVSVIGTTTTANIFPMRYHFT